MRKKKPIFTGSEWNFPMIEKLWEEIDKIGKSYGLNYSQPIIEIVSPDQMIDYMGNIGLPIMYEHWSFGKRYVGGRKDFKKGQTALPYEMITNTDPPLCYCMEHNSATSQTTVLAHAAVGHADFFKNNYLFRDTHPEYILEFARYARDFISKLEVQMGELRVENLLDAAHALMNYGVDKYPRIEKNLREEQLSRIKALERMSVEQFDHVVPEFASRELAHALHDPKDPFARFRRTYIDPELPAKSVYPCENILWFLEKYSPSLSPDEREVLFIVRSFAQYYYPQGRTKVMNEGWASFWHKQIMSDLWDRGLITTGAMLEFLDMHSGVIKQFDYDEKYYHGINPYSLGYAIFNDLRRICVEPTEEDIKFFPQIAGQKDWINILLDVRKNYIDKDFIMQWLSPKVMRDFKLFGIESQEYAEFVEVIDIHNDEGYRKVRRMLAEQYDASRWIPDIQIIAADVKGMDGQLDLGYFDIDGKGLDERSALAAMEAIEGLWGRPVQLTIGEK